MDFYESETKFKLNEMITWRDVDDELIVLELESGNYFSMNDVGRFIWLKVIEEKDFGTIVDLITSEYDTIEDQAIHDASHFIKGLIEKKIIECQ